MPTLAEFRTRVLWAVGVTVSAERGLTDANIDEHIRRAVEEFSLHVPAEVSADILIAGGSRAFATTALTRPIGVGAVEYPIGQWPRDLVDFDRWGSAVTLDHAPPPSAYTVRVYYTQQHLVDGSGSTITPAHENVLVEGAAALAILARAMGAANAAESAAATPQTYQHLRVAQTRLDRWRALLARLSGQVGRRTLYAPASTPLGHDIVRGPS